jgi:hypothetical protein
MPGLAIPTPYQWQVGDTGNAALLNSQIYNGLTYLLNPPIATLVQTSTQSIPSSAFTAITWPTPSVDTYSGWASGNPTRYTPQVAGYYLAIGNVGFASTSSAPGARDVQICKNGTGTVINEVALGNAAVFNTIVGVVSLVFCNGTTDYLELYADQNSGAPIATVVSGRTSFTIVWIHL